MLWRSRPTRPRWMLILWDELLGGHETQKARAHGGGTPLIIPLEPSFAVVSEAIDIVMASWLIHSVQETARYGCCRRGTP